jgi:hypothetical protein
MSFHAVGTPAGVELAWSAPAYCGTVGFLTVHVWRSELYPSSFPFAYTILGSRVTSSRERGDFFDATAVRGVPYHYVLVVTTPIWRSIESEVLHAVARTEPLTAPGNMTIQVSGTTISLQWEGLGDGSVTGYRVYRCLDDGIFIPVANLSASTYCYLDGNLTSGRYGYYVVALAADGEGTPSQSAAAEVASDSAAGDPVPMLLVPIAVVAVAILALLLWRRSKPR